MHPLQIGVVVVVNDFWTHVLTSNVLKIYFREHVLQFYQGQATFLKDLLSTPAASVVRTVVKWRMIGSLRNDDGDAMNNVGLN